MRIEIEYWWGKVQRKAKSLVFCKRPHVLLKVNQAAIRREIAGTIETLTIEAVETIATDCFELIEIK